MEERGGEAEREEEGKGELWGSVGSCWHVKSQQTVQFENVIDDITKDKFM